MTPVSRIQGGIDVCFANLAVSDAAIEAGVAILSRDELTRAWRLHFAADRRRFIASHVALRSAVSERTGIPMTAVELNITQGKPEIRGAHGLQFSMSRAGEIAAFAFAAEPVGIDLVAVGSSRPLLEAAAEFCSADELASISRLATAQRAEELARVWARKEALLKATGEGLSRDPCGVTVWRHDARVLRECVARVGGDAWLVQDVAAPEGYRSAVAYRVP